MNRKFLIALVNVIILCVLIFSITAYFIYNVDIIGWIIFLLGIICIISLKIFKVKIKTTLPDIIFGLIDNGILAILAVVGGKIAGTAGAIIGGVVGNAITDGIAGVFEGEIAEKLRANKINEDRTMLGSAVGKMAGCLLGAGTVLVIANLLF